MTSIFQPNWAVPPGYTIKDILKDRNITTEHFAQQVRYSEAFTARLLNGSESITIDIAKTLSETLGASIEFWLNRQSLYQDDVARIAFLEEKNWLKELPVKDMIKLGWINESKDMLTACLEYFGVPNYSAWKERYSDLISLSAFRTTNTFKSDPASVASWLRQGEKIGMATDCSDWNPDFFENSLEKIKKLTRKKNPADFLPLLKNICADCGVAIAIVKTPAGCRASGATMFLPKKALILLSFRYLSDDQFWFTFFHEAGHLLLHGNRETFIEGMPISADNKIQSQEIEANNFAAEILIPHVLLSQLSQLKSNKKDIIKFAVLAGVSPGIVIGQMQHRGLVDKKYLNSYKRRYNWSEIDTF